MKVLVSSNCASQAYFEFCKLLYPQGDVRMVLQDQVAGWVRDGHEKFLSFVAGADVLVCSPTARRHLAGHVPDSAEMVEIPGFLFIGHRPDCVWLNGILSPTGGGVIHSRIASAAFVAGKTETEAAALFNGAHYARLGYVDRLTPAIARTTADFTRHGIDISDAFAGWRAGGDFMYTPNHPRVQVFLDIMEVAMAGVGLLSANDVARMRDRRDRIDDYLADSIFWPVYPELAEAFGLEPQDVSWRTAVKDGQAQSFDLAGMISRSYRQFRETDGAAKAIEGALGGADNVALHAGV